MTTSVLVLGAGGSAAANVVDSLRRADHDYRIVGADADPRNLHLSVADERVIVPRADDPGYSGAIVATIEQYVCDIVHPQPDPDTRAIGALRDRLPARTFLPAQAVLELAADKYAFARAMCDAGVAMPENVDYDDDLASVVSATEKLLERHERVWVRARRGAGARASLPVRTG